MPQSEQRKSEGSLVKDILGLFTYLTPVLGDWYFCRKIKESNLPKRDKIASIAFFLGVKYSTIIASIQGIRYLNGDL